MNNCSHHFLEIGSHLSLGITESRVYIIVSTDADHFSHLLFLAVVVLALNSRRNVYANLSTTDIAYVF